MGQKTKFIIIGFVGILIIILFFGVQTFNAKQQLERDRDKLKNENAQLVAKIEEMLKNSKQLEEKLSATNKELNRTNQEKEGLIRDNEELQKRYDLVASERESLIEKLKKETEGAAPREGAVPSGKEEAYWASIIKAKTDLELQIINIRSELKTAQINNEQLAREKSAAELDISNLTRETTDLKRELDYNQKIMDSISKELVNERNDKFKIQESFKLMKNENIILRRQLRSLGTRKTELEKKVQVLQSEKLSLERKFGEMDTVLKDQVTRVSNLQQQLDTIRSGEQTDKAPPEKGTIELPPIVVRPQTESGKREVEVPRVGKILAINKENNFVIVDLGENAAVRVGDTFDVLRDGKVIANLEVIQTRNTISACEIKKEAKPVKTGDIVK